MKGIHRVKKMKKKTLVFKVEFDKTFDFLSWEFLDLVMKQMEFEWKCRRWISGRLSSSKVVILVDRSLMEELQIKKKKLNNVIPYLHFFFFFLFFFFGNRSGRSAHFHGSDL